MTAAQATVQETLFGKTSGGEEVFQYALTNSNGACIKVITYGGAITEIWMPDAAGKMANVTLGFDNLAQYEQKSNPYFGSLIGRVANRIGGASFELNSKVYHTPKNDGSATLHGGLKGFTHRVWKVAEVNSGNQPSLKLSHVSPDGDEGFPGEVTTVVHYTLTEDNSIQIDYTATCKAPTPINLTNHAYFNLSGSGSGDILGHQVQINAERFTPSNSEWIPTGAMVSVESTPYDLRKPTKISDRINEIKTTPVGYDTNFVLSQAIRPLTLAATVYDPGSGRVMEMLTTEPGVQFYTGNFLDGTVTGIGGVYKQYAGLCLEAQHFPDSVHHKNFPNTILKPGETYKQTTVYKFSTKKTD